MLSWEIIYNTVKLRHRAWRNKNQSFRLQMFWALDIDRRNAR